MIVCSCNVLSDHSIRNVVTASRERPLSAQQVYDCLGCRIRCGSCARAVKRIISEASTACAEQAPHKTVLLGQARVAVQSIASRSGETSASVCHRRGTIEQVGAREIERFASG